MKSRATILMVDVFPESFRQAATELGYQVIYEPGQTREYYKAILHTCQVLVLNSAVRVDEDLIASAPDLKLVLRAGVGTDHIEASALKRRHIQLVSTPGANAQAVGEMALGHLLILLRHMYRAHQEVRNFIWKREANRGVELSSLTVGIIGYGNTGQAFARMVSGSGCKILAYDKYKTGFSGNGIEEASLREIQTRADVLSFHIPLTAETRHWGNKAFFEAFSKSIYLLNLSRGEIVKTEDLPALLDSGKLLGAGLDVLEQENFHALTAEMKALYQQLMQRDNVIFTPHIGGWTFTSADNIYQYLLKALQAFQAP
jgi:D-3-phosphoglycerate dehydrogenase